MQATLIYNPNSGAAKDLKPDDLQAALRKAGYYPVYKATNSEDDLDDVLKDIEGLVVTAGGDGTIRAVATRLIGRGIPIAPLPLGTANNIAKSLELSGDPMEIIAALEDPLKRPFDIGRVSGPWGEDYFLEAAGFGLYAEILAEYKPEDGKSVLRSITAVRKALEKFKARYQRVWLDGRLFSGAYLLFTALNTSAFGPRLKVAPDADPSDGALNIFTITKQNRDSLLAYVTALVSEDLDELPSVEETKGHKVEVEWRGFKVHVDAEVRPKEGWTPEAPMRAGFIRHFFSPQRQMPRVVLEIIPKAVEFWLPQLEKKEKAEKTPEADAAPADQASDHDGKETQ